MYRRLREEQFCSDEHKDKYLSNQQQLALMRLQEVHTSLHPAPAVEETVEEPDESLAFHSTADYAGQNSGVRRRQSRAIGDNPRREIEAGAAVAVLAEPEVDEQPLARYGGDGFGGYGKNPPPDVYSTVFGGHEPEVETPEIDQYAEAALGTAVDLAGGEADVQAPVDEDLPSFANLVDEEIGRAHV